MAFEASERAKGIAVPGGGKHWVARMHHGKNVFLDINILSGI